jgi:N-acetylmuramoyl-L-alanine amidase
MAPGSGPPRYRWRKVRWIKGLALAIGFALGSLGPAAAETVLRFGLFDGASRVIVDSPAAAKAELAEGAPAVLTLPGTVPVRIDNEPVGAITKAAVSRAGGATRIALSADRPLALRKRTLSADGKRLVLDFIVAPIAAKSKPSAKPVAPKTDAKTAKPAAAPKRVVALDAGHGGVDPGAIAPDGMQEKAITLATAKALRRLLEARGFKVVMTRERDEFLVLRRRVEVARAAGAELFVSLHADSLDRADKDEIGGASIYTLSETASDAEAQRLAERENRVDALYGVAIEGADQDIASMLVDFAMRGTVIESRRFAEKLAESFAAERLRLLRNPLRSAGFAVLKAPDVPAVLVELGYLSNPKDRALLRDESHRERLAAALAASIERYFATVPPKDG